MPPKILLNNDQNNIFMTKKFKYIRSIIYITLQEDKENKKKVKQPGSTIPLWAKAVSLPVGLRRFF